MNLDWIVQGGPVMYPLLACSLVSVTITLERAIFWSRERRSRDSALLDQLAELLARGEVARAQQASEGSRDPIVRVLRFGLEHRHDSLEAALKLAANEEIRRMRRYLKIHDTIVTLAPLLGILGTVLGIITSFDVMGSAGVDNPIAVTGGIAEALLTTAVGLVVAMLSLIPYNWFSARLDEEVSVLESRLTSFEIMYRKGVAGRAS
ncbi:MAG: MotA/TolQ/ExbB proton channel family protein [Phycisphaerales bacterium]|nr:MotA/TolQ/ExbB proton channel family protein [Phycisphaerales bacterium]